MWRPMLLTPLQSLMKGLKLEHRGQALSSVFRSIGMEVLVGLSRLF